MESKGASGTPNTPTPLRELPEIEAWVAGAMSGPCAWPAESGWDSAVLLPALKAHGAGSLVWAASGPGLPSELASRLRMEALEQAAWEMRHQQIISEALEALHGAGIGHLVLKGSGLAYTIYPDPSMRTRGDTDLWVHRDHRDAAAAVLATLGFTRAAAMPGDLTTHEADFSRQSPDGSRHTIDLHWAISNTPTIAPCFPFDETYRRGIPATGLSAHARTLGAADALLLACIHRLEHHHHPYHVEPGSSRIGDRLIWLYDIHLLASAMNEAQWEEVTEMAARAGCGAACLDGLLAAARHFGTRLNARASEAMASAGIDHPISAYLFAGTLRRHWLDFANTTGSFRRLRLVRETFLPPADYIRRKYGPGGGPLPWLYARRAGSAIARLIKGAR